MYHLWKHIKRNPLIVTNSKRLAEMGGLMLVGFLLFRAHSDVQLVTLP